MTSLAAIKRSVGAARLPADCRPIDILFQSYSRPIDLLCRPVEQNRPGLSLGSSGTCFLTIPLYIDIFVEVLWC